MNDYNSLAHTTWDRKYHIVFAPKYRRRIFEDQIHDQMTRRGSEDPFTGSR